MYNYHLCTKRLVLCIDQKSFFASVSCILKGLDPLTTKLAVVADTKRKGSVVLAATPPLKQLGIKTGSRLFEIPSHSDIYIINPSMKTYLTYAQRITEIALRYVAPEDFHQYSVDEFFIDMTDSLHLFSKTIEEFAQLLKTTIYEDTGIHCAIGIGDNVLLSKLALDFEAKHHPTGVARIQYHDVPSRLWPLKPLSDFWGINKRTERKLNKRGIFTIGDLAQYPYEYLKRDFGIIGVDLHLHANGIDESIIREKGEIFKPSISKSQILMRDYKVEELKAIIIEHAEVLGYRLRRKSLFARTIKCSIGYSDGEKIAKQQTINDGTDLTEEIVSVVWKYIYQHVDHHRMIRTVSISLTGLIPKSERQMTLFDDPTDLKQGIIDQTMDRIKEKYGQTAVMRGTAYGQSGTALERKNLIAGHKK